MNIKILIIISVISIIFTNLYNFLFYIFIFKRRVLHSLNAISIIENENLGYDNSFLKKMFYKNALYIVSWIVPNIFLCCTTSLLIVLFARQELSKIFLSIFIIFNFVFHTPITSFFFKDIKFLNNHEKFYRFFKSHNCNKKQFFHNIIDEEKYELFISKLNNNIDIEYLGFNGKVIKKISLNDLKKICFRKGNFIQFNLDRFLFIEPKYLKVNDIEINMDELSFLRLYLIKKFN